MKIIKIVLIVFLVVFLIAGIAGYVFLKTFDINKYKPQILSAIKDSTGRTAAVGQLRLTFSATQGIVLNISKLAISDHLDFSKENFLEVENIDLGIDVIPLVSRREIALSSLQINSPKLILIRNKNGVFNVQTFVPASDKQDLSKDASRANMSAGQAEAALPMAQVHSSSAAAFPALSIRSVWLKNGEIVFVDQSFSPELKVVISSLDIKANDLASKRPSNLIARASLWSRKQNIILDGKMTVDLEKQNATFNDLKLNFDLSEISLPELYASLSFAKDLEMIKAVEGQLQSDIQRAVVGAQGLRELSLDGKIIGGKLRLSSLPLPIDPVTASFAADEKKFEIKNAKLGLADGNITGDGTIEDYLKEQKFNFDLVIDAIDLSKIVPAQDQPVGLEGKLFGQSNVSGKGFAPDNLFESLSGTGSLNVKGGKLKNINVLKLVLSKISMIPGLAEKVNENLPEKYKDAMQSEDTILKTVDLRNHISENTLVIDSLQVETDAFALSGDGRLSFDQAITLNTLIVIPQDLSEAMSASAEGLQYLFDENKQIAIPLRIGGKIPNLTFFPDLEYLGKRIMANRGREELEKVLDKVFKRDETSEPSTPEGQDPDGQEQPKSAEEELIGAILDKVFN
ncbi:MAG: AsmA family protein [Candidatus Omnitrophota bacterium]